jgi:hypothetical protein
MSDLYTSLRLFTCSRKWPDWQQCSINSWLRFDSEWLSGDAVKPVVLLIVNPILEKRKVMLSR